MTEAAAAGGEFRHLALLYRDAAEYLAAAAGFVRDGLARQEPVLVAVPEATMAWLHRELPEADRLTFTDMTELGRNPARIIPWVLGFAARHSRQPVRYLGEPAWPGRTATELAQTARHETLINDAFAAVPATMLCAYDATALPGPVITDAGSTHPALLQAGREQPSPGYLPCGQPASPFPAPPPAAAAVAYDRELRPVRALVADAGRAAGLAPDRVTDLVIAVSEVAANTLRHTTAGGTVWLWHDQGEVICQVRDTGQITDPLAGRHPPARDLPDGKGLWLVNQVCDLTELQTSPDGTTIRLHMHLP